MSILDWETFASLVALVKKETVSAHPGLVFVQSIKPGRSCFGLVELGLVIDPGGEILLLCNRPLVMLVIPKVTTKLQ